MKKSKKILSVIKRALIKKLVYINTDLYMKKYTEYLKKIGINFTGLNKKIKFIEPTAYIDGTDYSMISIGDNVTISREVVMLIHDYSLTTAMCSIGDKIDRNEGEVRFSKPIIIGNDCFIGARTTILPGTIIEDNCIIGACAVIKGNIPKGSVVLGNPARVVGTTIEFVKKHKKLMDYEIEQ